MQFRVLGILALALTLPGCSSFSLSDIPGLGALASDTRVAGKGETAASLNEFRAAHGLKPLRSDSRLTAMAAAHAADMARRNSLDHNGFMTSRGPAGATAENVAYGCKDTACAMRLWINSSGHRKNMLRTDVSRYGLASATAANGRRYWALEVGQ